MKNEFRKLLETFSNFCLKKLFLFQIKEENGLGISHPTPSRNTSTKRERSLSEKQGRNAKERTNQNGKKEKQRH